jgi:hypothetical protein
MTSLDQEAKIPPTQVELRRGICDLFRHSCFYLSALFNLSLLVVVGGCWTSSCYTSISQPRADDPKTPPSSFT